ncbi:MAG: DNA repair protein RecN [Deltaproteobacteria bacterium]|nr:MAG: DNA repair protein RecN [Deltaproteobacteria bacterium]
MLAQLTITDFAIIDSLSVSFSGGLNILSGETGAGKSIIINAVNLILGGRASPDHIRTGADRAVVEALFQLPPESPLSKSLDNMDVPFNGEVLIKRTISKEGKSTVRINGSLATLQILSKLGPNLISVSGQNEHQLLLRPDNHLFILDDFGALTKDRLKLNEFYRDYYSLKEKIERLRDNLKVEEERRELTEFQIKEIEEARLVPGEDVNLEAEKGRLMHAERLMEIVFNSYQALYERENSVLSILSFLARDMEKGGSIDPQLDHYKSQLESTRLQLEDLSLELRDFSSKLRVDPKRLEEVEERLQFIRRLKKKYGPSIEDILSFKEGLSQKGYQLTQKKEELKGLEVQLEEKGKALLRLATQLSSKRHQTADTFKKMVEEELNLLGMGGTRFSAKFSPNRSTGDTISEDMADSAITADGIDALEFMISPNVGEDLRPLAKIASGGELSRIMLALKTILARSGLVETLVFDEIDSGIGGATAAIVGEKLRSLASYHQVLCITHLPHIASCGETHFLVEKMVSKGRTRALISSLDKEGRINEIARLLGGRTISEKTVAHAREMLSH